MNRLFELLLGLDRGFLARDGDVSLSFDPKWPLVDYVGSFTWNVLLLALCGVVVWWVYLRDPTRRPANWPMAAMRAAVLALVVLLLNRPQLTVTQARVEPSVLAIMVDDSLSMRLADVSAGPNAKPEQRLAAVEKLLTAADAKLLQELAKIHQLRLFRFSGDAVAIEFKGDEPLPAAATKAIRELKPTGSRTRVVESVASVARELRGNRLAGALLLTDGRETEAAAADAVTTLRDAGVKLFPVPVGTDAGLRNVELESVAVQDNVFAGDIVNVKVGVRTVGIAPGTAVKLTLKDRNGTPILDEGKPVEATVIVERDGLSPAELQLVPKDVGSLDLAVEATPLEGEIDDGDNAKLAQVAVLDANLKVLYVDGYPRWEYRYLKQELIRDPSINVSCLLTSADAAFAQEGDTPITRFPETIEELLEYDVVLFGDVDPRQFTDNQLALVNEFVSRRGGGFGMIAGPQYAPQKYQNTAIEPLLPVDISRVDAAPRGGRGQNLAEGFRIALTEDGRDSSIFRFFRDPKVNADFVAGRIQELFWYCRGVTTKAGVGETLAQHPKETGPDGRPAPLVVVGRFGTGRTMFDALDESWRWRYYTGEQIFNSFWTQSLRTLARGKKLGQRKLTLVTERPSYQLGESVRLTVRVLHPQLLAALPAELRAQVVDEQGSPVREVTLVRRGTQGDYTGGFTADRVGRFSVKLPSVGGGVEDVTVPVEVTVPRLELNDPTVDRVTLARLAGESGGAVIPWEQAATIPSRIPSAQKDIPLIANSPLWAAPVALALFAVLVTAEWVLRKRAGLV